MRRLLLSAATALLLTASLPAPPAAASTADPVRSAEQAVAALQAEVDRTAAGLRVGTERLAAGQDALAEAQRRLAVAQEEAAAAQDSATAARDRLRLVVVAAYKSPVPDSFVLALSGPDAFRAAVVAQADLQRVRGRQGDLLREATAARVRAETLVTTVEQLTQEAARRDREVRAQVDALRLQARDGERRLTAATARLSAARAHQRAAQARAAALASCSGSPGGAANGFVPSSALCPLAGAPGHALRADAAAAFDRLNAAAVAERGAPLCVNDSYRSYAEQVSVFARMPRLAAVPGTSRHGFGVALDLGCGVERFGSEAYRWMKANGPRFGWVHPAWAEPNGSLPEPWHWEYAG